MKAYKESTFGWLIVILILPIQVWLTYLYINNIGSRPIDTTAYVVLSITMIIVCLLFYSMTTRITPDAITISFGIGIIRKKIPLNRIKSVVTVESPWYYGWGIRIIPNGMMYNLNGSDGVELTLNDTHRVIRIGTRDSPTLKKEIQIRLG